MLSVELLKEKARKYTKFLQPCYKLPCWQLMILQDVFLSYLKRIIGITGLTGVLIVSSSRLSVILGLLFCFNFVYSLGEFSNSPYV